MKDVLLRKGGRSGISPFVDFPNYRFVFQNHAIFYNNLLDHLIYKRDKSFADFFKGHLIKVKQNWRLSPGLQELWQKSKVPVINTS